MQKIFKKDQDLFIRLHWRLLNQSVTTVEGSTISLYVNTKNLVVIVPEGVTLQRSVLAVNKHMQNMCKVATQATTTPQDHLFKNAHN